ncbi:MAG: hypothetical protein GJ679_08850 [Rhodobacteraceae bacterium]|nr:hypothetical protein [Paracoccaceae bacterium]
MAEKRENRQKRLIDFKRMDDETNAQLYARGQRWVGAVDKRNKRYVALAELLEKLNHGKHIQNRTLQTHLTKEQFAAMEAAWAQQMLIRSGSKQKPAVIKQYETLLNRVQLQDVKAKELLKRGHLEGAKQLDDQVAAKLTALLNFIREAVSEDDTMEAWLDRPLPASAAVVSLDAMPRCITSTSKSSLVVRKTKTDIKWEAIQAAMRELE